MKAFILFELVIPLLGIYPKVVIQMEKKKLFIQSYLWHQVHNMERWEVTKMPGKWECLREPQCIRILRDH